MVECMRFTMEMANMFFSPLLMVLQFWLQNMGNDE